MGEDLDRVVFVGGTVTVLYPLAQGVDIRPTVDVDAVIDVATTRTTTRSSRVSASWVPGVYGRTCTALPTRLR
jgi:hypothetical protein